MSSAKNTIIIGLTGKIESSYGVGASASLAGPDSIQPTDLITVPSEYAFDGARPAPVGTFGAFKRASPNARSTNFQIPVEVKGDGTGTYTSGSRIPNIHDLLLSAGLSGSANAGNWIFKPEPATSTPKSIALNLYSRGELRPVSGGLSSFEIATDSAAPANITFDVFGLPALPTDVAVPAIIYEAESVIPPKAESIGLIFNFGSPFSTSKVRSFTYTYNRDISPRLDLNNASGHAGFTVGRRTPEFTCTIEAAALSTFDPETIWSNGTAGTIILTIGSVTGNTWSLSLPLCQISAVAQAEDGPSSMWDLTFSTHVSGGSSNDDLVITFS